MFVLGSWENLQNGCVGFINSRKGELDISRTYLSIERRAAHDHGSGHLPIN
jgi:hypothetical protein